MIVPLLYAFAIIVVIGIVFYQFVRTVQGLGNDKQTLINYVLATFWLLVLIGMVVGAAQEIM